jgi:hypothetical protein
MRRLCAGLLVTAFAAMFATPLRADVVLDPLHGYPGFDNGTNTPISTAQVASGFGFTVSPGPASGDLLLEVLVPNTQALLAPFAVTGTSAATASLVGGSPWTSGQLDSFLGISASPANPIGAFLPSTLPFAPGATGFSVYQADMGVTTLLDPSTPNVSPIYHITQALPLGSYIVGFLNEGSQANPDWVATANSGALFISSGSSVVPEPSTIVGAAIAVAGAVLYRVRRRKSTTA